MTQNQPATRVCCGVTITRNAFSAPWRRLWWITDIGPHVDEVRLNLIKAAGVDPASVKSWQPNIPFPSLGSACAAIVKATDAQSA